MCRTRIVTEQRLIRIFRVSERPQSALAGLKTTRLALSGIEGGFDPEATVLLDHEQRCKLQHLRRSILLLRRRHVSMHTAVSPRHVSASVPAA